MVKQGYKQTEIGVIPEDWDVYMLGSVAELCTKTVKTSNIDISKYIGTDNMVANIGGIKTNSISITYCSVREYKENDILLSNIRPYLKKIWISDGYGGCSNDVIVIRCNDTITYIPHFMFFVLSQDGFFDYIMENAVGTKMPRGDKQIIKAYQFPIPPLPEQERIAEALSDVDSLIFSLEKLIEKKKAVKQGAMQELLTGKKRLPGFTGEWECHRLGEYVDCIRGVSYNGSNDVFVSESNQTIRLLRSNNIQDAKFDSNDVQYIKRDIVRDNQILNKFDIMICMANGSKQLVGKNCIFTEALNERYTFGAFMSCLRATKSDTNMNYIFELLNSTQYWNNMALLLSGSSINNLRPDDILEMKFDIPSIAEQTAIASILSDMDNEIEALEKKLSKTRQLKQGMMQQLLTGRIRLV